MKTFQKISQRAVYISLLMTSLIAGPGFAQSGKDELDLFKKALDQFKSEKWEKAITSFESIADKKTDLQEYALYYSAQSNIKLNNWNRAESLAVQILDLSPNKRMSLEVSNILGQVALMEQKYPQALKQYTQLEKNTRNTEIYPEIIYNLAKVQAGLQRQNQACKWLVKLYERYPAFHKVANWSEDLPKNDFEGRPTDCKVNAENFRVRIRNLLWAGLDQKAQAEIDRFNTQIKKDDSYLASKLQAQFYLQNGDLNKALELMIPFYESKKKNFDFLIFFGSAAGRAGDLKHAVNSYYSAYKLNSKSKVGRQALYQSAFYSYQYQDYDGAGRRFKEFIKVYPTSGLSRDAQWHLAWIKYLKADYEGAYKAFAGLQNLKLKKGKKRIVQSDGRIPYWMAMCLYRLGKVDQAKAIMSKLAKDPLFGYYAVVAEARLKKMELQGGANTAQAQIPTGLPTQPRMISRFVAGEFLLPSSDKSIYGDEADSEEDFILNQYSVDDEKQDETEDLENSSVVGSEGNSGESIQDEGDSINGNSKSGEPKVATFDPKLLKRFERAKDLILINEKDWARWDLLDVEKKTSNRDHLRTLMNEYNAAEVFNRSSYIAQVTFGSQRASQGIDGARNLWEYAYPRAYSSPVENYTEKFVVPEELVWGIMRAESTYRRDAISPVGALGLMQVMPFTAHKVANLLKENNFKVSMLLESETAIKVGTRYLKRLMDNFDNTIPLVAAGYNAGPHRVKNWLSTFGNLEFDEFIEHIPFLETRNYVKRVVSNSYVYAKLYGKKKDIFPYLTEPVPVKLSAENSSKENWDDI